MGKDEAVAGAASSDQLILLLFLILESAHDGNEDEDATRVGQARDVPQRRCMKFSHGENRTLSARSPMAMMTSMTPIT